MELHLLLIGDQFETAIKITLFIITNFLLFSTKIIRAHLPKRVDNALQWFRSKQWELVPVRFRHFWMHRPCRIYPRQCFHVGCAWAFRYTCKLKQIRFKNCRKITEKVNILIWNLKKMGQVGRVLTMLDDRVGCHDRHRRPFHGQFDRIASSSVCHCCGHFHSP